MPICRCRQSWLYVGVYLRVRKLKNSRGIQIAKRGYCIVWMFEKIHVIGET